MSSCAPRREWFWRFSSRFFGSLVFESFVCKVCTDGNLQAHKPRAQWVNNEVILCLGSSFRTKKQQIPGILMEF